MKPVTCDVDLSFSVDGVSGEIKSSENSVDIRLEKFADIRVFRRAVGVLSDYQDSILRWSDVSGLSLRVWVRERLIAESGTPSGKRGLVMNWGRYWRIRPVDILSALLKR